VLGIALLFDGTSFIIALHEFNKQRKEQGFWEAVTKSKDPTNFVVLFEDAADVLGLIVAFAGVYFGHKFQNPYFDGGASVIIGFILAGIATVLARESYSLLMGETASKKVLQDVVAMMHANENVIDVKPPMSMFLAPEEIVLVLRINFKPALTVEQINIVITNIKKQIQIKYSYFKQIMIEPTDSR
jgi:divalent metal cation (Fe/Co/Zn/Cd) transporter